MEAEDLPLEELELQDKRYLWHPFTPMKEYVKEKPLIIEEGKGVYVKDIYGRWYLDGVSSLWANVHGHRREEIDNAIARQLRKIAHSTLLGLSHEPAISLARKLVEITPPGLTRVFYSDNGATAVEIALKMAFQYWQQRSFPSKQGFICFKNGYHGDTLGAVAVGGIELFHGIFKPLLFAAWQAESPYCYRCPVGQSLPACHLACLSSLEKILERHHQEVAALIIEPVVQGAGGMIVFPPGFLRQVRELCRRYNVLMIADEVATGFGRTGRMFACEHEDVQPDILALAKGLTGGYLPLAATLTTDEIYYGFWGDHAEQKTFFHGHTYTGNPLACAAAMANLEIFEKDHTLTRMQDKIIFLAEKLKPLAALPHVGEVRQKGFMVGIELVQDKQRKRPYPFEERIGWKVILEARRQGLIIRPLDDVLVLLPPLSITTGEIEEMVDTVYRSVSIITGDS